MLRPAVSNGWRAAVVCSLAVLALTEPAWAASDDSWAMAPGWQVFTAKGCGTCHRVREVGQGTKGPDLARPQAGTDLFSLGAAMWNHLSQHATAMREAQMQRPQLTPIEMSDLASFLFTVQHFDAAGNAEKGQRLFEARRCSQCHPIGGTGATGGPALDAFARSSSPARLGAAMWNHGPAMAEAMAARGMEPPSLSAVELADLLAYIVAAARPQTEGTDPILVGSPTRGGIRFADKGCARCHAVGGAGQRDRAPRLGTRAHHVSVTEFASLLWNHRVGMSAAMKRRGVAMPTLTGQDLADIIAYLHSVHYFDPAAGDVARGRKLLSSKGCLGCHSVYGHGARTGSDLAKSNVVGSPAGQVAAMWNHGRFMETAARRQRTTLPTLTGRELADIATYLAGLGRGTPKPR
jgi:mono/diheme cytochrome c family protein